MQPRLIAAVLGLTLYVLAVVGCGGNPQQTQTNGTSIKTQTNHSRADGGSGDGSGHRDGGGSGGGSGSGGSGGSGSDGGSGSGGNCGGSTAADFYVATNGKDSWSGTLDTPNGDGSDGPFATLNRARQAIQGMPGGKHSVMLRGGNYFLGAPVVFSAADSGAAGNPIVYESYPCETAVISGGRQITGWTNVSGNVWTVPLSSSSYQNFEGLFYNSQRRYRPRTTLNSFLFNAGPVYSPVQSSNCSVLVNGQWECFDRFNFSGSDIASSYHSIALGDVEILDFEKWTMSRMRLQSVDASNHIAYLTGPTAPDPNNYGFLTGHRYLIENVQEALNQPGQWYLDRCTNPPACTSSGGTWTLTYLAQTGENPAVDEVIIPQQSQLLIANGLQNVTFNGITFAHDNWLPLSKGLGDTQGSFGVTAGLSFNNSSNIIFDSVHVTHTQGWGIEFVGDTKGKSTSNQVVNSTLSDLGGGGIRIGKRASAIDTETNVPQYNLIQNNLIVSGGRVIPSGIGTGVWVGNSHNNTVTHNEINDFYSGAIRIGFMLNISQGVGNAHDNIVSYNLLYNLGQGVTSDMGAIYFADSANKGNMAFNNVIHDVTHNWQNADGYGAHGIYFDQGASNVVARNNLVYRTSGAAFFNNISDNVKDIYPQNNVVDNNIFVMGYKAIQRGADAPSTFSFTHNIVYIDKGTIQGGKWSCFDVGGTGLPVPCSTRFFLDNNVYFFTDGKTASFQTTTPPGYTKTSYSLSQWQNIGEDVHSLNQDPMFTNPAADDYTLQPGSPAFQLGFVPFDYTQAGRTTSGRFTASQPPPAFPLQLMQTF